MDEFKTMLEADEMSTVDDVVSIVDRVRNELEENEDT
jgi:hypothetical protein